MEGTLTSPVAAVQFTAKGNKDDNDTTMSVASTPTKDSALSRATTNHDTPNSQSSTGSYDPTVAGRRRGKKRRLEQRSTEQKGDDGLSFDSASPLKKESLKDERSVSVASSADSRKPKMSHRLDQITARILDTLQKTAPKVAGSTSHNCGKTDRSASMISTSLPLVAMSQIISGKIQESEKSCIDDDHGLEEEHGADEDHNPLLETNRLLGVHGVIPLLSQALAETLAAVTQQLEEEEDSSKGTAAIIIGNNETQRCCAGCLAVLEERVSMLASLVDGASLLSDSNRKMFCEEGYTNEAGGFLIMGLLSVLRRLLLASQRG